MKTIQHIPILKGSIFIFELEIEKNFLNFFKKLKYEETNDENYTSKISTNLNLLKDYNKDLKELDLEIKKSLNHLIKEVYEYDSDFFIFKSWATKTEKNQFSFSHRHCNSWLSGVYYPEYDPEFIIEFYNDYASTFATGCKNYNIYNCSQWKLNPKKNTFIVFSSELRHKIFMNNSKKTRYSLALNVLPNGKFGLDDYEVCFNFK